MLKSLKYQMTNIVMVVGSLEEGFNELIKEDVPLTKKGIDYVSAVLSEYALTPPKTNPLDFMKQLFTFRRLYKERPADEFKAEILRGYGDFVLVHTGAFPAAIRNMGFSDETTKTLVDSAQVAYFLHYKKTQEGAAMATEELAERLPGVVISLNKALCSPHNQYLH